MVSLVSANPNITENAFTNGMIQLLSAFVLLVPAGIAVYTIYFFISGGNEFVNPWILIFSSALSILALIILAPLVMESIVNNLLT